MDQTVILAKNADMSMFVYDGTGKTRSVSLANLTLQDGRVGMHLRGQDVVDHPLSYSFLSHITFRNMSEAGVFVDMAEQGSASFDNNMISFCNFVNCASGIKQRPAKQGGWGFIDKLVAGPVPVPPVWHRRRSAGRAVEQLLLVHRLPVQRQHHRGRPVHEQHDAVVRQLRFHRERRRSCGRQHPSDLLPELPVPGGRGRAGAAAGSELRGRVRLSNRAAQPARSS